jgi:hypothetical protein
MKMRAGLLMYNKSVSARLLKSLEVPLWLNDHKVHIEKGLCSPLESFNHVSTERNRWNERPVHYINVQPVGTRRDYIINLLAEPRDIRGKNRWSDNN